MAAINRIGPSLASESLAGSISTSCKEYLDSIRPNRRACAVAACSPLRWGVVVRIAITSILVQRKELFRPMTRRPGASLSLSSRGRLLSSNSIASGASVT